MTTQVVPVGMNIDGSTGLYGGTNCATAEEKALANNGCGTRITAIRKYHNWFTQPFAGGSDELTFFNSGHLVLVSVSNLMKSGVDLMTHDGATVSSVTHKKVAAGNYDAAIDAGFDRIAGLNFDQPVATLTRTVGTTNGSPNLSGTFTAADVGASITGTGIPSFTTILSQTGTAAVMSANATATASITGSFIQGICWPHVEFIYEHEVDAAGVDGAKGNLYYSNGWVKGGTSNGTKDTATDFINAWKHIWGRWQLRAAANGVPTARVKFNICFTSFGFSPDRVSQYYPGSQWVDIVGVDPYPAVTSTGYVSAMSAVRPKVIAWAKPMSIPEFNFISTSDSARPAAFNGMATAIANETQIVYDSVCLFLYPDSTPGYAVNKVAGDSASGKAYPLTHAAYLGMINTLGGNPPITTGVVQQPPSTPVIVSVASNAAGTQITLTWANPPGGDNVTGWDVYLSAGFTNAPVRINAGSDLASGTRLYNFTQLVDGTPIAPGQKYTAAVVAINGVGRSGYSNPPDGQLTTLQPGPTSSAPVITGQGAAQDPVTATTLNFTVTATSPLSRPLTITHVITGPSSFTTTLVGSTVTVLNALDGTYLDTVTVADNATPQNKTPVAFTFSLSTGGANTPLISLAQPQPGDDVADDLGPLLRANNTLLDTLIGGLENRRTAANTKWGFSGSSFPLDDLSGANAFTPTAGMSYWAAFTLEDTQLSELLVVTGTAPSGTGLQIGIHDANGALLIDFAGAPATGTNIDTAFANGGVAGIVALPLGLTILKRTFGELLFARLFYPTGMTGLGTLRCGTVTGPLAKAGAGAVNPLWGSATESSYSDPIAFSGWTSQFQAFVAVQ